MLGIELIDWIIIVLYLVGITLIGLWAVKKVHSSSSFFFLNKIRSISPKCGVQHKKLQKIYPRETLEKNHKFRIQPVKTTRFRPK